MEQKGKRCIVCEGTAKFFIKGTNDYYCEDCAKDSFGDVSVLVAVEEKAKFIKQMVDETAEGKEEIDPDKQFVDE